MLEKRLERITEALSAISLFYARIQSVITDFILLTVSK